jgi:hypothetical protein
MSADFNNITHDTAQSVRDMLEAVVGGDVNVVMHLINDKGEVATLSTLNREETPAFIAFMAEAHDSDDGVAVERLIPRTVQ